MDDFPETKPKPKGDERPITEAGTPEDDGNTMTIPMAFVQGTRFKPGDELVLKVVSVEDDGLEVAYAKAPEGEDSDKSNGANAELDNIDDGY